MAECCHLELDEQISKNGLASTKKIGVGKDYQVEFLFKNFGFSSMRTGASSF